MHWQKGVQLKTENLKLAQQALNSEGSENNRQAIYPMTGDKAGDPNNVPKTWAGGSGWWEGGEDLATMRKACSNAALPLVNVGYYQFFTDL